MKRLSRVALWSCALLLLVSGSLPPCSLVAASGPPTTAATLPATDTPTPQESTSAAAAAEITVLQGTLAPLVEQFNKEAGKPRVLALLSPT